jgi:hypothetical protein
MITGSICFVIGAGASNCYRFPIGKELCLMVTDELRPRVNTFDLLIAHTAFQPDAIERFRSDLLFSGQNSIDAFLELRPDHLNVGKAAMAAILLRYEIPDRLWTFDENNWLRYLFEKMRAPTLERFGENNVSFVTFNFDRSLEHFLFTSLQRTYGASDDLCANVMSKLNLIHLHRRLGYLPWQKQKFTRPYMYEISQPILEGCVNDIKLVHEELEDTRGKDFEAAKSLMRSADRLYFLGFGFGQLNIDRLDLKGMRQGKGIATAHGLTQAEINPIFQKINQSVSIYPNHDINSLFRELVNWE